MNSKQRRKLKADIAHHDREARRLANNLRLQKDVEWYKEQARLAREKLVSK